VHTYFSVKRLMPSLFRTWIVILKARRIRVVVRKVLKCYAYICGRWIESGSAVEGWDGQSATVVIDYKPPWC